MNKLPTLEESSRQFLGKYSLENGISQLKQLNFERALVLVPNAQIKEKLESSIESLNFRFHTEFEAALTFFEGSYPRPIVRELICLRIIRSKEGSAYLRELFPLREAGVSEARTLLKLFDELFILGRTAQNISEELTRLLHLESERWINLSSLENLYFRELSKIGFDFKPSGQATNVVLFGLLKLSPLIKKLISSCNVTAFVFDTPEEREKFNHYGEIVAEVSQSKLPQLEFVSTPRNYLTASEQVLGNSNCGVILFDESEKRVVTQQLTENGYSIEVIDRNGARRLVSLVRTALKAFSSKKLFDLNSLLRIIAVEDFVVSKLTIVPQCGVVASLDEYQSERLQLKWTTQSLPKGPHLEEVTEVLKVLLETFMVPLEKADTLARAVQVISSWCRTFYPEYDYLAAELDELQSHLPEDSINVEESIGLILSFISTRAAVGIHPGKLRIFDSLDSAYYQESQSLVLWGAVSGRIPKSKSGSVFLNDGILKILGEQRDETRIQRYFLSQLASSIKSIVIPRFSLTNDPTSISPLLYPVNPRETAQEVLRFFDSSDEKLPLISSRTEIVHPLPKSDLTPLRNKEGNIQLSITALDFYTVSPFRFYLERILQAQPLTDEQRELAPNQFGDLAHLVLRSIKKLSQDSTLEEILLLFEQELDRISSSLYGSNISATVETQFYNLKERLSAYARYELKSLESGWKTIYIEKSATPYAIETSIEPVLLTARVDRIDYNEELRTYRIWDYKTGDNTKSIFKRDSSISSLQLPLYAFFLGQGLFGEFQSGAQIEVGYIALGSFVTEPSAFKITQSNIEEVVELAKSSAENLANRKFELGETERVNSNSDFSIFLNHQKIDFGDEEADLE